MGKIVTRNREEKKKLKFIYKSTNSREFVEYLKPKLQYLVHYNFIARCQDQQFKNYI
jgi:hypothetical protein